MAKKRGNKKQARPKRLFRRTREDQDHWPHLTNPHNYRYYFHPKHHGAGSSTDSRWKPDISKAEEFSIFELAAPLDLCDNEGNLYNVRKASDDEFLELGIFHEQIARFWKPSGSEAWHGHPLWPVETDSFTNRSTQKCRPEKAVFDRFIERGVLNRWQCDRLRSGKHI